MSERVDALREYRDALARNESAEHWVGRDAFLHDLDDWIKSEHEDGCNDDAEPKPDQWMGAHLDAALARATAPVADKDQGWETTAAILAYEVNRLRDRCCPLDCPHCHDGCGCPEDRDPIQ